MGIGRVFLGGAQRDVFKIVAGEVPKVEKIVFSQSKLNNHLFC